MYVYGTATDTVYLALLVQVAKLVSVYSPIWSLSMAITIFVTPSILLLQSLPQYHRMLNRIKRTFRIAPSDPHDQLQDTVSSFQLIVSELLTALSLGMAFGTWSPVLLLQTAMLSPILLIVRRVQRLLQRAAIKAEAGHDSSWSVLWQTQNCSAQELHRMSSLDVYVFCQNLVAFIKVPVPRTLIRWISIFSLWFGILVVLFDFGCVKAIHAQPST